MYPEIRSDPAGKKTEMDVDPANLIYKIPGPAQVSDNSLEWEKEKRMNLSRVSSFMPSRILLSSTAGRFRLTNCRQLTYANICLNRKEAKEN